MQVLGKKCKSSDQVQVIDEKSASYRPKKVQVIDQACKSSSRRIQVMGKKIFVVEKNAN